MSGQAVTSRNRHARPPRSCRAAWRFAALALAALCAGAGCGNPDLQTRYGSRQGINGGDASVNGTGVLAEMFTKAGHSVNSVVQLSPAVKRNAGVIVWFPADFSPPSRAARDWLESWLTEEPGRTLIYVGRDFDAEEHYWAKVLPQAAAGQAAEIKSRQTMASAMFLAGRAKLGGAPADWGWFTMDGTLKQRSVRTLSGDANWTSGLDPTKVEIELYGRISPSGPDTRVLLRSKSDVLVFSKSYAAGSPYRGFRFDGGNLTRRPSGESQMVVVANGSFLLNLQLVNKQHRKLAVSLIREVGEKKRVYFLESGGSPEILDKEPEPQIPSTFQFFGVVPTKYLLLHLAALALVVGFAMFPIFGRARETLRRQRTDFGQHVDALGELLSKTRDSAYARDRLRHYHQLVAAERARGGERRV